VVTNSKILWARCETIKDCGRPRRLPIHELGLDHRFNWHNLRITQFQASILIAQLERMDEQLEKRMRNREYLDKRLSEVEGVEPVKPRRELTKHQPWPYAFRYNPETFGRKPIEKFIAALKAEGIPCSRDHPPLHIALSHSRIRKLPRYPVAERAYEELVTLPHHIFLGEERDMDDIVEAIEKIKRYSHEL
jgi:dTDP-4-amino-4,6-dideoxygalactose transaminase